MESSSSNHDQERGQVGELPNLVQTQVNQDPFGIQVTQKTTFGSTSLEERAQKEKGPDHKADETEEAAPNLITQPLLNEADSAIANLAIEAKTKNAADLDEWVEVHKDGPCSGLPELSTNNVEPPDEPAKEHQKEAPTKHTKDKILDTKIGPENPNSSNENHLLKEVSDLTIQVQETSLLDENPPVGSEMESKPASMTPSFAKASSQSCNLASDSSNSSVSFKNTGPTPSPQTPEVDAESRFIMSPSFKKKWTREFISTGMTQPYLDEAIALVLDFK